MRFINLVMLYVFFLIIIATRTDLKAGLMEQMLFTKVQYNRNIDRAVEDAMENVVWAQDYRREVSFDREAVLERFFGQIYQDFGIGGEESQKSLMRQQFPAIVITTLDGFYLYKGAEDRFMEKQYFEDTVGEYRIRVTFQDYLYIEDKGTGERTEGTRERLKKQIPLALLGDAQKFEQWKKEIVITAIREAMEEAVNQDYRIAQRGHQYRISFPAIQYEEWYQTVDQISMLAFFCGNPQSAEYYGLGRFVFGGARLQKR